MEVEGPSYLKLCAAGATSPVDRSGMNDSAGSDAHSPWELGRAYVQMAEFEGPGDFLEALRKGEIAGRPSNQLVHLISLYAMLQHKLGWRPSD